MKDDQLLASHQSESFYDPQPGHRLLESLHLLYLAPVYRYHFIYIEYMGLLSSFFLNKSDAQTRGIKTSKDS